MINRLTEKTLARNEQVMAMRAFMSSRKVSPELQAKIRCYLESQAEMRKGQDDYECMNLLSPQLRNELTEFLNNKVITKHPFFSKMPAQAIRRISLQAVPTLYGSGDTVVERGHLALSMHFVVRGKLRVEKAMGKKSVYLEAGSWLGDKCLFIDAHRTHCVSSVTPSEVLCVQKRTILAVCNEFPYLQMHYEAFQKRICDGENISLCPVCKKTGHNEEDCPMNKIQQVEAAEAPTDHPCTGLASLTIDNLSSMLRRRASRIGTGLIKPPPTAVLPCELLGPSDQEFRDVGAETAAMEDIPEAARSGNAAAFNGRNSSVDLY